MQSFPLTGNPSNDLKYAKTGGEVHYVDGHDSRLAPPDMPSLPTYETPQWQPVSPALPPRDRQPEPTHLGSLAAPK